MPINIAYILYFYIINLEKIYPLINIVCDYITIEGLIATSSILVGLLIPIAILLLENSGNLIDQSFKWDKLVIFSQVVKIRSIIFGLTFITFPLILKAKTNILPIILILYVIGLSFMFSLLKNAYYWIISKENEKESYRNSKRYQYLNSMTGNIANQITIWDTIWGDAKQRAGLDELKLLEIYFKHCKVAEGQNKLNLLNTYLRDYEKDTAFKVTYHNYEIIQDYIYHDLSIILNDSLSEDFGNYDLLDCVKELFFKFTEQCYSESEQHPGVSKQIIYKYTQNFSSFFIKSDKQVLTRLFSNDFDIKIIRTILNSKFTSYINLEDNLPSCFKYENSNLTAEHQNIIVSMFSKCFDNYLNSAEHYDVDKVFLLNELLKVVFNKIDLSLYITMENFRNYYIKKIHNRLDIDNDDFMLEFFKEYAFNRDNVTSLCENVHEDTKWTKSLLMSIYSSRYSIFTNNNHLNKLSKSISFTIENVELDTKEQKKLNYLKQKIDILIGL
ncbi:hypothetical protein R6K68_04910 [Enterococcus faecium]|uniref:hypothetical protein n=2 Tax=Enterococcus faecium TaxID=1352 RepID=UPI001E46A7D0|nr:hypothetical protein [Enterococcus faecium]MCD5094508.1 hypothetical protein [Enterococcus faecium]MCD5219108.1 hypothetical protein [Enterococcus faecium]MDG4568466.1 hypothetical protein [Enterococcus faecium]MDK4461650.1 hypothetical protein [Enterococcus faecium]MDW3619355.1 hypothetical protein [Enterococcus faecium]